MYKKWCVFLVLFFSGACLLQHKFNNPVSQLATDISPNKEQSSKDAKFPTWLGKTEEDKKLFEWIEKLETYENCPAEGIIDCNGKKSYSALCWQMHSFKEYTLKYIPISKEWEEADWLNNIADKEFQKELAYLVLKDNPAKAKNLWYTTVIKKGFGLP